MLLTYPTSNSIPTKMLKSYMIIYYGIGSWWIDGSINFGSEGQGGRLCGIGKFNETTDNQRQQTLQINYYIREF